MSKRITALLGALALTAAIPGLAFAHGQVREGSWHAWMGHQYQHRFTYRHAWRGEDRDGANGGSGSATSGTWGSGSQSGGDSQSSGSGTQSSGSGSQSSGSGSQSSGSGSQSSGSGSQSSGSGSQSSGSGTPSSGSGTPSSGSGTPSSGSGTPSSGSGSATGGQTFAGYQVTGKINLTATAYGPSAQDNYPYGAVDYFGNALVAGDVAVDPRVIPLGTWLWVQGYSFSPYLASGGFLAHAIDTGGAIKGNRIDLFVNKPDSIVTNFGIQPVTAYILNRPATK